MLEFVFSVSDIVSIVLILVEIKCFNKFEEFTNGIATCDAILKVLKAAFGWSGIHDQASSSIRKVVAKIVLFPKFVFSVVAFLIEWGILYSENISLENNYPGGRWTAIGISTSQCPVFLAIMFYVICRTNICESAIFYFGFLLFYRVLDLEMNSILLWLSVKYDEINPNSIVTHLIFIYSIFEVVVGFLQFCKALVLIIKCFMEHENSISPL